MEEEKKTPAELGEESTTENPTPVEEVAAPETTEAPAAEEAPASEGEKDTTVELRENYEETVAESEEVKKPKKKLGKGKLAIIIVAAVLAAIILAVGLFFGITRLLNKPIPSQPLNTHPTRPAVASTISAELQAKLDLALTAEATDAQKAEAAMELYALANQNKINADKCLMVAQGDGKASVTISGIEAIGTMSVRAFKVQDNGSYYYQKGAKVTDTDTLDVSTLSKAIDKQERAYAPAGGNNYRAVIMSGAAARLAVGVENVEDVFFTELPFLQCDVTNRNGILAEYNEVIEDKDTFLERAFVYSGDPKEINNFNYRKEAISDVTIELFEDNGQNYYDINFMADVTDEETVKVARDYLRESSGAPDLEFTYLKVNLKIWDNGYIRSFMDWEKWAGNAKIGPIDGKSSSDTSFEAVFYWDYDSLVSDGILKADDEDIKEETYTADIIKKYASQPGWYTED